MGREREGKELLVFVLSLILLQIIFLTTRHAGDLSYIWPNSMQIEDLKRCPFAEVSPFLSLTIEHKISWQFSLGCLEVAEQMLKLE